MPATTDNLSIHCSTDREIHPWLRDVSQFPHRPSLVDIRDLEHHFCKDFTCCDQTLGDLHDLLEHYEECHVRLEEEDRMAVDVAEHPQAVDDVIVTEDLDVTGVMTPMLGMKRINLEENQDSQPICPSSIANIVERDSHKRQRSVPPDSPRLTIDTLDLPSSFSAVNSPTALGEDFLARAGLVEAGSTLASFAPQDVNANKPFRCSVPGCDKAYKNPNGLKYHNLHGHHGNDESDTEKRLQRPFECTVGSCRKRYKNLNGLKYHVEHSHLVILNKQLNNLVPQTPNGTPSP